MSQSEDKCIAEDCERPAEWNRKYCYGHRKQEKTHRPIQRLRPWGLDPDEYLRAKALEYAKAEDDTDGRALKLAGKRLEWAAREFARRTKRQKVPEGHHTPE
jgi:hypothetical protein